MFEAVKAKALDWYTRKSCLVDKERMRKSLQTEEKADKRALAPKDRRKFIYCLLFD